MIRVVHLILCTFITTSVSGQAWQFEIEGGVNSSGLPKSDHYGGGKERIKPRVSPVFGLHVRRSANNGLYVTVGARYANVGTKTLYHKSAINQLDGSTYTFDIIERYAFSRFSLGGAIGYKFPLWKKEFFFQAGYRTGYYASGNYRYHAYTIHDDGSRTDLLKSFDPFTEPTLALKGKRKAWEFFVGVGMNITSHWSLGLQYALTPQMSFIEQQTGPIDTPNSYHTHQTNDFCVTASYLLRKR